jgi:hypothetical protein
LILGVTANKNPASAHTPPVFFGGLKAAVFTSPESQPEIAIHRAVPVGALMTMGLYNEPAGAWMPSVLY